MYRNKKASSKYLPLWDWRKCKNSFKGSYKNSIQYSLKEQISITSNMLVCLCRHCQCVLSRHHVMRLPKKRTRRRTDMSTSYHVRSNDVTELVWTSGGVFTHVYHCKHLADILLWFQVRVVLQGTDDVSCAVYWDCCMFPASRLYCFLCQMTTRGSISPLWRASPTLTLSTPPL